MLAEARQGTWHRRFLRRHLWLLLSWLVGYGVTNKPGETFLGLTPRTTPGANMSEQPINEEVVNICSTP